MSDFDTFGNSDAPAQEEDPAADFLAREQEELAELNDDNFTGAEFTEQHKSSSYDISAACEYDMSDDKFEDKNRSDDFSPPPAAQVYDEVFSYFSPSPAESAPAESAPAESAPAESAFGEQPEAVVAYDDLAQFEIPSEPSNANDDVGDFGGYDALGSQQAAPASLDIFNAPASNDGFGFGGGSGEAIPSLDALDQRLEEEEDDGSGAQDPYSSVRSVDTQRKEPEKIRIWHEEQVVMLEQKDKDEKVKMEEWREQAKKELDDWYRHRDEQFQKAKALNREHDAQLLKELQKESESEFIKERDETVPGHEWERICRLCEFNPKHQRSQKDASRMRSILLQLKQNPTVQAKVM